jgi:hypothetical protein
MLSGQNLSVETNLNHFGSELVFLVVEGPLHGALFLEDSTTDRFTALGTLSFYLQCYVAGAVWNCIFHKAGSATTNYSITFSKLYLVCESVD